MRSTDIPAAVRLWAEQVGERAEVALASEEHGWWVRAKPHAAGAVGFTLGISDQGEYDLFLDNGFSHEAWPWPEEADAATICRAIAAGRVRVEIDVWRGRELWRLVSIDCPPDIWTDLNAGLLDLLIPRSRRVRRVETATPY
jgi:hypothetical protein